MLRRARRLGRNRFMHTGIAVISRRRGVDLRDRLRLFAGGQRDICHAPGRRGECPEPGAEMGRHELNGFASEDARIGHQFEPIAGSIRGQQQFEVAQLRGMVEANPDLAHLPQARLPGGPARSGRSRA